MPIQPTNNRIGRKSMDENLKNAKNLGVAALVCGILGIVGSWIPVVQYFVTILAILGIVFGAISMKKYQEAGVTEGKGLAVAGLVLGIIAVALDIIVIACTCVAAGAILSAAGSAGLLLS